MLVLPYSNKIGSFFQMFFPRTFFYFLPELPSKPTGPIRVADLQATKTTLQWQPPYDDGGVPLVGYNIEVSRDGRDHWQPLARVDPSNRSFVAENLTEGSPYSFRISAENKLGASVPLLSDTIIPRKRIGK